MICIDLLALIYILTVISIIVKGVYICLRSLCMYLFLLCYLFHVRIIIKIVHQKKIKMDASHKQSE